MLFETRLPDPRLSAMILGYWRLEMLTPGRLYAAAPKRHVEFVVNVGTPQLAGAEKLVETPFESCWLTGLRETPIYILPTGPSIIYGVRFQDFSVPDWLSGDLRRERRWSTDLGLASPARSLAGAIAGCTGLNAAARIFDAFFLSRSRQANPLAQAVRHCARESALTPAAILHRFDGSIRQARELAQDCGGLTLRRFARLARFDRALIHLGKRHSARIADIALDVGYYDEAHMAHDFADFCGVTPGAYRRAREIRNGAELPPHIFACD